MNEILNNLAPLFEDIEYKLYSFKRETYSDIFHSYLEENQDFFAAVNGMLETADEMDVFISQFAQQIVDYAAECINAISGKGKRERAQLDYNMFMAVYFMPAILEGKQEGAQELTNCICEKWAEAFKDQKIKSADFETIASGFKSKLCYITTAVCKSLKKTDDCYELELLRDYRDNYLVKTQDGKQLVEEYYDIAPTIVKRIDKSADAEVKYRYIWEQYLKPCIMAIEQGKLDACGNTYMEMVEELRSRYMTTAKDKEERQTAGSQKHETAEAVGGME